MEIENTNNKSRFFNDLKFAITWGILGLIIVSVLSAVFLSVKTFKEIGKDQNGPGFNVVTVSGKGEVLAVPDIATINFTVKETSESVSSAQKLATEKINKITALLKEKGIEEKDIKTTSYNIYPKQEWRYDTGTAECLVGYPCPPNGRSVIIGYDVSQTTQVKVREVEKAGDLLSLIGNEEISNVSGLQFSIDDEDSLKAEARSLAIADAKEKAQKLADDLGVKLKTIVSFNEEGNRPIYDYGYGGDSKMMYSSVEAGLGAPELSMGEDTIISNVSITFEID